MLEGEGFMKKEWVALLIALILILSACGRTEIRELQREAHVQESSVSTISEEMDSVQANLEDSTEENLKKKSSPLVSFSGTGMIEETVLVDEKDVRITLSNLSYGSNLVTMELLLENNSSQDLSFISGSIGYSCNAVNGYSISSMYVNEDVSAGMKSKSSISISKTELDMMGITDIAEIEIGFKIETTDYDDYMETGPIKIDTSAASSYDLSVNTYQQAVTNGTLSSVSGMNVSAFQTGSYYSSGGVNLISAALLNGGGTDNVLLELENTSDQVIHFRIGNFAINNLVISTSNWDSITLNPNGRGIMSVDLDNMADEQERNAFGIGDIAAIAFCCQVEDKDYNEIEDYVNVSIPFGNGEVAIDASGTEIYNSNGIRIVSKGTSDDWLYHYLLLTIINDTSSTLYVDDEYNSTSVNGFMVDNNSYSVTIEPGQAGGMKYGISSSSLEENDISTNDIKTVSFQLKIGSGDFYNYIDQPKLTLDYK